MILLIPVSPEVPQAHKPTLWPGVVLALILLIAYFECSKTVDADNTYIDSIQSLKDYSSKGSAEKVEGYLRLRPLLRIAPSKEDWDFRRILTANFLHGSLPHLGLNLIGAFAGARIVTTFMPFLCTLSIFVISGSVGLWLSLLVTPQSSGFIPHLGASAGIFGLMGAYYVYNFHFRTRYFFWFPGKHGQIALKTSWFLFVDAVLLEIVLSTAQLFPDRLDPVDHIAHVTGFLGGMLVASFLRSAQGWPAFLQTRAEFLFWTKLIMPRLRNPLAAPAEAWLEILSINPYNDLLKRKLARLVYMESKNLSNEHIARITRYFSPTFIRLNSEVVGAAIKECVSTNRPLPKDWLAKLPYDSAIYIAKKMTQPPHEQVYLLAFLREYQELHPHGSDLKRKLDKLTEKLGVGLGLTGTDEKTAPPVQRY